MADTVWPKGAFCEASVRASIAAAAAPAAGEASGGSFGHVLDVSRTGRCIDGVRVLTKSGVGEIRTRVLIDASGDT